MWFQFERENPTPNTAADAVAGNTLAHASAADPPSVCTACCCCCTAYNYYASLLALACPALAIA